MGRAAFFVLLVLFVPLSLLLWCFYSTMLPSPSDLLPGEGSSHTKQLRPSASSKCEGRWIYVYNLSESFNHAILERCRDIRRGQDLCPYMENSGMGREVNYGIDSEESGSLGILKKDNPWFNTWQFSLEIYFHERLKKHPCTTSVEADANAFYVPYYAGMDLVYRISHHLPREALSHGLLQWLKGRPSWRRKGGRDHFITLGRIARDFRMPRGSSWGSQMLLHPEWRSMVKLTLERDGTKQDATDKEIGIPYPTFFHPVLATQVQALAVWLLQSKQRVSMASMAGRNRNKTAVFRQRLFDRCEQDQRCSLIVCVPDTESQSPYLALPLNYISGQTVNATCSLPSLLSFFHRSEFCLQPAGDSPSRRSYFDAMLAGCIPVIFDRNSAWTQYTSHLPVDGSSYSIYIPQSALRRQSIFDILHSVPKWKIKLMREKIAELLPRILYTHTSVQQLYPNAVAKTPIEDYMANKDSFERAIDAVLMKMRK
ncbi:hypothetical protein O6H91_11G050400 [Diphasiastrum complanatum]|nr:hypothetical protein O6H91_11G050400 [Diphasiastrum complanatum]